MVANISLADPPRDPEYQKVEIQLFFNIVVLNIKGNREIQCSNIQKLAAFISSLVYFIP